MGPGGVRALLCVVGKGLLIERGIKASRCLGEEGIS